MNFYKSSIYTLAYTFVFQLNGLIITKITAHKYGPAGSVIMGDFNNLLAIFNTFTCIGISSGFIKYIAEFKNDELKKYQIFNTGFTLVFIGSLLVGLLALIGSKYWSIYLFNTIEYYDAFMIYGATVILFALQIIVLGFLNGNFEIKKLAFLNVVVAIAHLILTVLLIQFIGIKGAMITNITMGSLITIAGTILLWNSKILNFNKIKLQIDNSLLFPFFKYGALATIASFLLAIVMIKLRDYIQLHVSDETAGYWTAMNSLSDRLSSALLAAIIVYFLPKMSEDLDQNTFTREVRKAFKRVLPITALILILFWLSKDLIIQLLLSIKFYSMRDIFGPQMVGLFFKVGATIFSTIALGKAMIKTAIFTELIYLFLLYNLSLLFINYYGWKGGAYGYAVANILYFFIYAFAFRGVLVAVKKSVLPKPWIK